MNFFIRVMLFKKYNYYFLNIGYVFTAPDDMLDSRPGKINRI